MSAPLQAIADAVVEAVPQVLAGAEAGTPILLPRGADPFAGADRPLLLAATRWTAVSPGGVIVGGTPEAVASVLGFELPERPEVTPENASQHRRATDGDDEPEPEAEPEPETEPEAEPEGAASEDDQADGAEDGEAPAPARRWSDHVADACREPAATAGDGLIRALAALAGLPHGAAATQTAFAESDATVQATVGPLPDAVVVPMRRDGVEVRLVVVVAGIVSARIAAAALEVGSASGPGAAPVEDVATDGAEGGAEPAPVTAPPVPAAPVALGNVPLDLCAEIGTARMPLSSVLSLREGAVVELTEVVDAPVALVAGTTTVAGGELELDDDGALVLHVTTIPGRPDLTAGPVLVDDPAPAAATESTPPSDG